MFGSTPTLATMGAALPYAIAAKFDILTGPAWLCGDGAMQMDGVNELITVAKYWRRWSDPRLVVLVLNNRDLSYVSWEQRAMVGDIRFEASQRAARRSLPRSGQSCSGSEESGSSGPRTSWWPGRGGVPLRSSVRARGDRRHQRPAAATARHARAGHRDDPGAAEGRPGPRRDPIRQTFRDPPSRTHVPHQR